jgi:hypothetical protein
MMDLVKNQPETIGMSQPVPPIENKRTNDPIDQTFHNRIAPTSKMKYRLVPEIFIPGDPT